MLLKMAYRNIFRHKRRTILTLIVIIYGIFFAVFGEGLNVGMEQQLIDIYRKTDISTYKIYDKGYFEDKMYNNSLNYIVKNSDKLISILGNKKYSARIHFQGSITNGIDELRTDFLGVNIGQENEVFQRDKYITDGEFNFKSKGIVIGKELAEMLELSVGDYTTIIGKTMDKSINAYDLQINGIIETGNPLMDKKIVFMDIKFAKQFVNTENINDIAVLDSFTENEIKQIEQLSVEVIYYKEEVKDVLAITKIRRKAFFIISLIILIMGGVGIANTMLMAMLERQKEIGIMMANGMEREEILKLFLLEGGFIGFIGSSVGFLFGAIVVKYFNINGIPIGDVTSFGVSLPISNRIYMKMGMQNSVIFLVIGVLISVLATFYSAYKATKLNPLEVMRIEH